MKQTKQMRRGVSAQKTQPASSDRVLQWLTWARKGLIALMLLTVPALFYLGNTEYGYTKSIFALITTALLATVWFTEIALRRNYALRLTPLFWPGLALIMSGVLSLISLIDFAGFKILPTFPIGLQTLTMMFYFGLLYFIMAHSIENERDLKLFLGCLMVSAVPVSIYGAMQYYGLVAGAQGVRGGVESVISTLGNRNYLASFLGHLIPVIFVFLIQARLFLTRIAIALSLVLFAFTLYITDSAAIWLGFGVAGLGTLLVLILSGLIKTFSPQQKRFLWVSLLVLALGGAFVIAPTVVRNWNATAMQGDLSHRVSSFVQNIWEENSGNVRIWDWWIGYEMWKTSPLVGQGVGTYKIKFLEYKAVFRKTEEGQKDNYNGVIARAIQAHNEYIQVLAEMGVLGLTAMLALIGALFASTFKFLKLEQVSPEKKWMLVGALAGVIVFLIDSFFSFPLHLPASALNLIFLLGLLQSKWLRSDLPTSVMTPKWARPALVFAALLAVTVTVFAARDFVSDICLDSGQNSLKQNVPGVAKEDLECSAANEFAPSEVYFELGKVYDQFAAKSSLFAKQSKIEEERKRYLEERDIYFKQALDNFSKALILAPNETVYYQIASLYLQQGGNAKDEKREADAKIAFENSKKYINLLLDFQPDDILRLAALFHRDVMVPLSELEIPTEPNLTYLAEERALGIVTQFINKYPEYSQAYFTRAELYRQIAEGELKQYNQSQKCALSAADLQRALEIVNQKTNQAQAVIGEINKGIRRAPAEVQQLRSQIDQLQREKKLIQDIQNNLSKTQC